MYICCRKKFTVNPGRFGVVVFLFFSNFFKFFFFFFFVEDTTTLFPRVSFARELKAGVGSKF